MPNKQSLDVGSISSSVLPPPPPPIIKTEIKQEDDPGSPMIRTISAPAGLIKNESSKTAEVPPPAPLVRSVSMNNDDFDIKGFYGLKDDFKEVLKVLDEFDSTRSLYSYDEVRNRLFL